MGIFDWLKKGKAKPVKKHSSLLEDIATSKDWIAKALLSSGYNADFTLESLKEIDRFFDEQINGLLAEGRGAKLFAVGSYIGEVLINQYGGQWITDDDDPTGEINIAVKFDDGSMVWPVQRAMKRFQEGEGNDIFPYVLAIGEEMKK